MKRCQSPSSLNTYKQCPRKYFYQYIKKLKTSPSIHTLRGNIVHSVLEDFFTIETSSLTFQNFKPMLHQHSQQLLVHHWTKRSSELQKLPLDHDELRFFFEETNLMLTNWVEQFAKKIHATGAQEFAHAFLHLTPKRETHFINQRYNVQGFIDAIEQSGNGVRIMDYKTSSRFNMTDEYFLQLSVYAMLYAEEKGTLPDYVGLYFLKDTSAFEHTVAVSPDMIERAKAEIEILHMNTQSEDIRDYPKKEGPLCKWRTGQCDFYHMCFGQKTMQDFSSDTPSLTSSTSPPATVPDSSFGAPVTLAAGIVFEKTV